MKKAAVGILAAVIAAGMCACSSGESVVSVISSFDMDEIRSNFDKAYAYVESTIDTTGMIKQTDDEQEGAIYAYWSPEDAEADAEIITEIDVEGNTVVIGQTTLKDLEGLGYKVDKASDTVEPNEIVGFTLGRDEKTFSFSVTSIDAEGAQPIEDLPICEFHSGNGDYSLPFEYAGLKNGATLKEAIEVLGMPNSSISLCADLNTTIQLSYFNAKQQVDTETVTTLELYFAYDTESDSAVLTNITFSSDKHSVEA